MITISFANANDFRVSPYPVRLSLPKRTTPSTTPINRRQPSVQNLSPVTRASIEIIPNSAPASLDLISRVRDGIQYHNPELCEEGVNGTYFMKDKNGKKIAVFKPQDEEASSENNPKSNHEDNLSNKGILPGEAAAREVAAFLLDREHFYGVPRTLMVKITHSFSGSVANSDKLFTKIGSLQEFVDNDGSSEDFGPKNFPTEEVHKIGILDLHIFNVDRHAGNVLIRRSRNNSISLVPIDQGFSFPDTPECSWFEWMNWPQAKVPFSEDTKAYIMRMDAERDARTLKRELGIRSECLKNMKITVALLKKAVELDLTLYDIGIVVCRKNPDTLSVYEEICQKANFEVEAQVKRELKNQLSNDNSEIKEEQEPVDAEFLFQDLVLCALDLEMLLLNKKKGQDHSGSFVKRV